MIISSPLVIKTSYHQVPCLFSLLAVRGDVKLIDIHSDARERAPSDQILEDAAVRVGEEEEAPLRFGVGARP